MAKSITTLMGEVENAAIEYCWALQNGTLEEATIAQKRMIALREKLTQMQGKPLHRAGYSQRLTRL